MARMHGAVSTQFSSQSTVVINIIHEVNKIASESCYKTLKLWKVYDCTFMNISKNLGPRIKDHNIIPDYPLLDMKIYIQYIFPSIKRSHNAVYVNVGM